MRKLASLFSLVFHGAYDTSTLEGRGYERNRRIALTAFTGAIAKILAMSIPLVTIKITYDYLGEELYGLWGAVTSFFALFQVADLGLGNGLKTRLSQVQGRDNLTLSRKLISSTFAMLLVVAILLIITFLVFYPIIDWSKLMNAKSDKAILLGGGFVFAIVTSRILMIPLSLIERTQLSLQEGYRSKTAGTIQSYEFEFSINSKKIYEILSANSGKRFDLHYKEYHGVVPWRGNTKYVVDSIISMKDE